MLFLPDEKCFLDKFMSAVKEDEELKKAYFARFDAYYNAEFPERSCENIIAALSFYGGYRAKRRLIESIPIKENDSVLDIGPEMGVECFLLAEVYEKVIVAEPDAKTCEFLQKIASHYVTEKGAKASEILDIKRAGIIPADASGLVVDLVGTSTGVYAFDARDAKDIGEVFGKGFADRVICNHIVQVMPKEPKLKTLLEDLAACLKKGGWITWADSIPEVGDAVVSYLNGKEPSSLNEIQTCIRGLITDFKVDFRVLQKPHQLLTVAERI